MLEVKPHDEIWFEDGNVLLIAESTSFRVHKSILARHSEFFHDMFKLPQPAQADGDAAADGDAQCPAVDTSESAEDLAHFLSAMYNSIKYFRKDAQLSFTAVRAILRLSQKFSSEPLRTFAIGRLQAAFPRRFASWEALLQRTVTQPITYDRHDLLSIANFAHELELTDVLPVVLYDCCQVPLDWILDGVERVKEEKGDEGKRDSSSDGNENGNESASSGSPEPGSSAQRRREEEGDEGRITLTRSNRKAVVLGRERLTLATVKMVAGLEFVRDGRCDQYTCPSALREVSAGGMLKGDAVFDPLTALNRELATDPPAPPPQGHGAFGPVQIAPPVPQPPAVDVLCRVCKESCQRHLRVTRERILMNIEEYIPVDFLRGGDGAGASEGS